MRLTNSRGSRVAGRGRGSNVAAGENDLKTTDMKTIWREKIFFMHDTLR